MGIRLTTAQVVSQFSGEIEVRLELFTTAQVVSQCGNRAPFTFHELTTA